MAGLALLIAESAPQQKDLMICVVMALLEDQKCHDGCPTAPCWACARLSDRRLHLLNWLATG